MSRFVPIAASQVTQVKLACLRGCPLGGRGSRVADEHVGAGPAGHGHQPGLGTAVGQRAVGCGVAQLVGLRITRRATPAGEGTMTVE